MDKDSLYHSNTPQFNHESFMRRTSRSSNTEDAIFRLQSRNNEDYQQQAMEDSQLGLLGMMSQNPSSTSLGNIISVFPKPTTHRSFVNEDIRNEIMEDANESKCSSIQDKRRYKKNAKIRKHSGASDDSNNARSQKVYSTHSSRDDSFRSSISLDQEVKGLKIPHNVTKSNENKLKESIESRE